MSDTQTRTTVADPAIQQAAEAVEAIMAALQEGKAPRGRRQLQEAVRVFRAANMVREAAHALRVQARLEARRGDEQKALTAARSALRLVRPLESSLDTEQSLDVLAQLYAAAGEHEKAWRHAEERLALVQERREPSATAAALHRLALVAWEGGQVADALYMAVEAGEAAERTADPTLLARMQTLLGALLLKAGCPTAANRMLTTLIREQGEQPDPRALVARGCTWSALGRPESAARDFRRAARSADASGDARVEAEATALLAAVESARARAENNTARQTRATATTGRAGRLIRRLRDPRLERTLTVLAESAESAAVPPREEVARTLVALAQESECLVVVDACRDEVERLATLGEGAPAYAWPPDFPLLLE